MKPYEAVKLNDVKGHSNSINQIKSYLLNPEFLPHALLFTGPTGVGKSMAAKFLSKYLNCKNPISEKFKICGQCNNCKLSVCGRSISFGRGIHFFDCPNVNLSKDINTVLKPFSFKPMFSRYMILIFDEVQAWAKSQEKLLNSLDNISDNHKVFATTNNPGTLSGPFKHRFTEIGLDKLDKESIAKVLTARCKKMGINIKQEDLEYIASTKVSLNNARLAEKKLFKLLAARKKNPNAHVMEVVKLEQI